ncbi:Aldo/keto reductase [Serendipita vermifera]|nr:Aldo/keto reductase [Serendipita vermifera]
MSTETTNTILHRLGKDGPLIPALGYGAMGLSAFYPPALDDEEGHAILQKAIDLGCVLIDTADMYGPPMGKNERLIGGLIKDPVIRSKVFLCTKFGPYWKENFHLGVNGKPEYVRQQCEQSLKNLQTDYIDLYYQLRVDRSIPIEETWTEMAKLQAEGKVRYLGISEATPDEIRRAHSIAKISAYQIEFSPWTPDIKTNGILDTCRELGISVVAYSPLGRGLLSGKYTKEEDFPEGDLRRMTPRFKGEALKENLRLVNAIKDLAEKKGVTPSQLTLAWILAQGDDFFAIPGTKKEKYLIENHGAVNVTLTQEEMNTIDEITQRIVVIGGRYPSGGDTAF